MDKIVSCETPLETYEYEFHPNHAPRGWREITEKEFAQSLFFSHTPDKIDHRQILYVNGKEVTGPMIAAFLYYFYDGTGIAVSSDFWNGKVHYYHFGCSHKYTELGYDTCQKRGFYHAGNCWHVSECSKCGFIESHDTSD
jgi:hypothetical protein